MNFLNFPLLGRANDLFQKNSILAALILNLNYIFYYFSDEDAFKAYHEGFKNQVAKWPLNPLDEIIKYIKSRSSNLIVADFGCGEAKLAQQVP